MTIETQDESTDTSVRIGAEIAAEPATVWRFVGDPRRHADFDGSGMIIGCETQEPITSVDQMFVMDMVWTDGTTRYRTENYVTQIEPEKVLEWLVADEGRAPQGWRWGWSLEDTGRGTTLVRNYCDWGEITDPEVLEQKNFPVVDPQKVAATLERLGRLVDTELATGQV